MEGSDCCRAWLKISGGEKKVSSFGLWGGGGIGGIEVLEGWAEGCSYGLSLGGGPSGWETGPSVGIPCGIGTTAAG